MFPLRGSRGIPTWNLLKWDGRFRLSDPIHRGYPLRVSWAWFPVFFLNPWSWGFQPFRPAEPVVLAGSDIPEFAGVPVTEMRLMALIEGGWVPVPVQIDEKGVDGSFFSADDGLWDANDQLVFQPQQGGLSASIVQWVEDGQARQNPRLCVEITDPVHGGQRWVYLYRSATLAPFDGPPLVDYDAGEDLISGQNYQIGFDPNSRIWNRLFFMDGLGVTADLFDREKLRIRATVPIIGTVNLNEEDVDPLQILTLAGPVRIIRLVEGEISLLLTTIPFDSERHFYRSFFEIPGGGTFQIPDGIGLESVRISTDFSQQALGGTVTDPNNTPLGVDGIPDAAVQTAISPAQQAQYWYAFEFMGFQLIQGGQFANLATDVRFYYHDDDTGGSADGTPDTGDGQSFGDSGVWLQDFQAGEAMLALNTYIDADGSLSGPLVAGYLTEPLSVNVVQQQFADSFLEWIALWGSGDPLAPDVLFLSQFINLFP